MTRSPSVSSSVGPGELPLYAKTSHVTPGFNVRRVTAAVSVTSTVPGCVEMFWSLGGWLSSATLTVGVARRPLHVTTLIIVRRWTRRTDGVWIEKWRKGDDAFAG